MRLMQLRDGGGRFVAGRFGGAAAGGGGELCKLRGYDSVFALARAAAEGGAPLAQLVFEARGEAFGEAEFFAGGGEMLPPLDHPDPARLLVSGTGLTHLGSAKTRDEMHSKQAEDAAPQTDSMRMFNLGVQGGKPPPAQFYGAQPEWFYKGDGNNIVAPGGDLLRPAFALDGGEEPEIAGLYIIDGDGAPRRIGFALGNEFSDHIMEKENYLYLAHSKLRQCSFGPELLLGELPPSVEGVCALRRGGEAVWQKPFFSGEDNMCHSIANLERHHFKYAMFCAPWTLHAHFFGTATLSFADGVLAEDGDEFAIESAAFGRALTNRLRFAAELPQREARPL